MKASAKILSALTFIIIPWTASADFPYTQIVEIEKLEVWPSNKGFARFGGFLKKPFTKGGCKHPKNFYIEAGPGAEAAYNTLLAATLAGKKVELYFTKCNFGTVADRIRVIID